MRSTKAQVRQRVEALLEVHLAGAQFHDLRVFARESGWSISDAQLRRYVRKIDDILSQTLERDRQKIFNRHIGQRRALFARAMSVSDYPTCLRILRDEAELFGLYPSTGRSSHQPEAGSSSTVLEQVYLKIVQHIEMKLPDREMSAEQQMVYAQELRRQADALEREAQSNATNQQPAAAALPG
jgi:hypothetical protein